MTAASGFILVFRCSSLMPDFCTVDGAEFPLWKRVEEQAKESYAMKEVFDMDSSVRVEAIENLGKSLVRLEAIENLGKSLVRVEAIENLGKFWNRSLR